MVKYIYHLADIHIRTYRYHDEYVSVFNKTFEKIKELSKGLDRKEIRIVIAGDLVHQKITISNEQLMLGSWFISELEKIAPVVIIAGNHDLLENNKDRMDSITPMVQFLQDKEISYFKESICYLDDNIVWCPYSIFEENKRPNIEAAKQQFGNDKKYVGIFHAPIVGSKTDIGYEFEEGSDLSIFNGCDMVLLGDIHKRNFFTYDNGEKTINIGYSSSLVQQNFGEKINGHGFLMWDVETGTFEEYDIENDSPYFLFSIDSIEDLENNKEKLTNL